MQALASQHTVLKGIIRHSGPLKPASPPPPPAAQRESYDDADGDNNGQVILYASRLELTLKNQNLKSLLDSMHWRVMELEKVCSRMKTQMTKMKASRRGGGAAAARSLPRMCS